MNCNCYLDAPLVTMRVEVVDIVFCSLLLFLLHRYFCRCRIARSISNGISRRTGQVSRIQLSEILHGYPYQPLQHPCQPAITRG